MRWIIATIALVGFTFAGCLDVQPQPALPPTTLSSWGPMGGLTMSSGATCAGHATLANGAASVVDPCFTGSDNIVLCTDTTAADGVSCAPVSGSLLISGFGNDVIAYARVR